MLAVGVALLAGWPGMITQQDGRKEEKHKGGTDAVTLGQTPGSPLQIFTLTGWLAG